MHSLTSLLLLGGYAFQKAVCLANPHGHHNVLKRSVDTFVQQESPIALERILCNVGSDGCSAQGVAQGALLASPSRNNPNYYYMWTRDSALTFKTLVDAFVANTTYDQRLQGEIENYIIASAHLQGLTNPSGTFATGDGIGEPKWNVDLTAFTGSWGRPQRDGPALRAIAMIAYSNWLITNGYTSTANSILWPIIRNDLNYVAQYWNQTGFDLWEEVQGSSFFTTANQHRALVEGSTLAKTLNTNCAACDAIAPQVLCFLQTFWSPSSGYIVANTNENNGRSGKDVNSILSIISTFDPIAGCDSNTFQPCSDLALANHKVVTDSFRTVYSLNNGIAEGSAVNVGRYPEDVYYGGNPWYLATLAAAEQMYDALYVWKSQGYIEVTSTSVPFFNDFSKGIAAGKYNTDSSTYNTLYTAVNNYADDYFNLVATYAAPNGSLSEQYGKADGKPLSAYDLTWSYAAFLTAAARRDSIVPASWKATSGNSLPATCSATSIVGYYSTATATAFPTSQPPANTMIPQPTPTGCSNSNVVVVRFDEVKQTQLGDTIKMTGNLDILGNWVPNDGIPLSAANYTSANPLWSVAVSLAAGQVLEYKFVSVDGSGSVTWEEDPNHTYTVPVSCATATSVSDKWQQS